MLTYQLEAISITTKHILDTVTTMVNAPFLISIRGAYDTNNSSSYVVPNKLPRMKR